MTVIAFYLVVMTSAWTAQYGPYPIEMCAALIGQTEAALAKPPRAFLAKVMCVPAYLHVGQPAAKPMRPGLES